MAITIDMPKLSDTMTVGTLVTWLKKVGEPVSAGDMIAEVETDKATMEVECFEDGVILKHYVKEGEQVAIGAPMCAVGAEGEEAPEVSSAAPSPEAEPDAEERAETEADAKDDQAEDKSAAQAASTKAGSETEDSADRVKASPLARKIARDLGIDLAGVEGSGPHGRIVKADVLAAQNAKPKAPPTPPSSDRAAQPDSAAVFGAGARLAESNTDIPITNMRGAIARALVASVTQSPHFFLQMEIDAGPLTRFRDELNARLADLPPEKGGIKFSVNDLVLKACAEAVRRVPDINRSWQGEKIVRYAAVHLAFAVSVPDGLVTPVIRHAETKSLRQISVETRELAVKARDKKIRPEEMAGSTLTVTNLGMFGISDFYGIINPPNAAIISVGAALKAPMVNERNEIVVGYRMKVGLSGDHRTIDGVLGAQYLAALREILETPALMLV